jgi:hypothetical protein
VVSQSLSWSFDNIHPHFAHLSTESKNMILSQRLAARSSSILPQFDGTRIVMVFKCKKTGQWVIICSCKAYLREGLKCRHMYAATGSWPDALDAIYRHWNDFDLAFLGDALPVEIRRQIWKTEKLSRKTSGALMPEGMTCLPVFINDRELEHFTETLDKPDIVRRGFWATRKGSQMIDVAIKRAKLCGHNELKRFGITQRICTRNDSSQLTGIDTDSDSENDSDSDSCLDEEVDHKAPIEALALRHPELLQTVGRKHWDGDFTKDMGKAIAKRPGRECKELINQIQTLVNNPEKANHWWHILQYSLEDFMFLTRMEERQTVNASGMIGNSTKSAGKKRSNKRFKRSHET